MLPPATEVILGVLTHRREGEDAALGALEETVAEVRRVDSAAIVEALLLEQNREGVDLLARRAARVPDP